MTDSDLRFPDDAPDSAVAGALRPLLAPPHDDYWGTLERAIMARIAEQGGMLLPGTPADFAAFFGAETEKWGKVVRAANLKAE